MSINTPAVEYVDNLLSKAEERKASDLYIEPYGEGWRARFRVDGFFMDEIIPSSLVVSEIIARIKVLSRMMSFKNREPQEGRIPHGGTDIRVSVLPTVKGERVVLRFFSSTLEDDSLTALMQGSHVLSAYRELLNLNSGVIFVAGPSGSGKTTTLYSSMQYIQSSRGEYSSLVSVEDPVEKILDSVQQTEVGYGCGVDFSDVLPFMLRQDPEVIMVGETRDPETAQTVMQAGLTGHLVLTTIHTEDASGVLPRLRQLGVSEYLFHGLAGILSQRLARKLKNGKISSSENTVNDYSGRCAFFELFTKSQNCNDRSSSVRNSQIEINDNVFLTPVNGMRLKDDGLRLYREGHTSIEELLRVLGPSKFEEADYDKQ